MLNTKEYFNQLDATLAVNEIDNETAATIQGGAAMTLYRHGIGSEILGEFNGGGLRRLSTNANNQASSVKITAGKWKFYDYPEWNPLGASVELGVGTWNFVGLNDKISSFKRVS